MNALMESIMAILIIFGAIWTIGFIGFTSYLIYDFIDRLFISKNIEEND